MSRNTPKNFDEYFEANAVRLGLVDENGEPSSIFQVAEICFEGGMRAAMMPDLIDHEKYDSMKVKDLAAELKRLKETAEAIGKLAKIYGAEYKFLSESVLPEVMDEQGIQTMKIEGVGRLQLASDIQCSVLATNRDLLKEWLVKNGHASMVSETISAPTLKAFIREQMKAEADMSVGVQAAIDQGYTIEEIADAAGDAANGGDIGELWPKSLVAVHLFSKASVVKA
tara:strand:+ start:9468 stop:10145 length:678 start_codon:yes stop_codon:yes gene_type:complete